MARTLVLSLAVVAIACGDDDPEIGTIAGIVSSTAGAVANAEVSAAGASTASAADGSYELTDLAPGTVDVSVTADWYTGAQQSAEVTAGKTSTVDVVLSAAPLRVEAADAALATTFNASADWTGDSVSIVNVPAPTRAAFELAIHYRNPALYRDPGGESQVTPAPLPTVLTPSTFNFEVTAGVQALDNATIEDDVADTGAGTPSDGMVLWEPALTYLLKYWPSGDVAAVPLYTAGVTVRDQRWGDDSFLPTQAIERVHLHDGDIWVEVVFQEFVDLETDVTDVDGDGLREIWARVNPVHFDPALYAELRDVYVGETHGTLELADVLVKNLDELYSRGTNANIVATIGESYTHADLGTIEYPFAVVLHGTVSIANVFLIGD